MVKTIIHVVNPKLDIQVLHGRPNKINVFVEFKLIVKNRSGVMA